MATAESQIAPGQSARTTKYKLEKTRSPMIEARLRADARNP